MFTHQTKGYAFLWGFVGLWISEFLLFYYKIISPLIQAELNLEELQNTCTDVSQFFNFLEN